VVDVDAEAQRRRSDHRGINFQGRTSNHDLPPSDVMRKSPARHRSVVNSTALLKNTHGLSRRIVTKESRNQTDEQTSDDHRLEDRG